MLNGNGGIIEKPTRHRESALFELIMRRHNRRLFGLARGILGNDADAEDVLQDTYVNAYLKLQQFWGPEGLSSWLYRIATNEGPSCAVASKGSQHSPLSLPQTRAAANASQTQRHEGCAQSPESELYSLQLQRLLEQAVDGLPDVYRTTFVMRKIAQLSATEIAQSLGIEETTVKTRVHRARRLLQQQLSDELRAALGDLYRFDGERCDRIIARVFARLEAIGTAPAPSSLPPSE
jgi:RNA polymerase sigma-70 factor (ECF subfamily)